MQDSVGRCPGTPLSDWFSFVPVSVRGLGLRLDVYTVSLIECPGPQPLHYPQPPPDVLSWHPTLILRVGPIKGPEAPRQRYRSLRPGPFRPRHVPTRGRRRGRVFSESVPGPSRLGVDTRSSLTPFHVRLRVLCRGRGFVTPVHGFDRPFLSSLSQTRVPR